jgi:hypothetical protein
MRNQPMTTRARGGGVRWVIAALLCGGTMLIAACSSNASTSASAMSADSGSPAGQAKVNCANVDSLRGSLESFSRTPISESSTATLTADLENIAKQAAALKGQAGGKYSGLSDQLSTSVAQINKTNAQFTKNPTAANEAKLTTGLTELKGKAGPTIAELNKACPKPAS